MKKITDVRVEILLLLIEAFSANLSLPARVRLWKIFSLDIFSKVNYKASIFFSKKAR